MPLLRLLLHQMAVLGMHILTQKEADLMESEEELHVKDLQNAQIQCVGIKGSMERKTGLTLNRRMG